MRLTIVIALILGCGLDAAAADLLRLIATIPMPAVGGRIDHFAQDGAGSRLFVAALGNGTVEVLDLAQGRALRTIAELHEPQGLAYLPDLNRLLIAEGDGGAIDAIDAASWERTQRLAADDADNVRVDAASALAYVGSGAGRSSTLMVVDARTMTARSRIPLPGHPEAFALDEGGPSIFVNVPSDRSVVVVDRVSGATLARWPLTDAASNYPLALDAARHRLLVGCRSPARLLIFDTRSGSLVGSLACAGDADDIFIDAAAKRIYVIGGEGAVTVIDGADADHLSLLGSVETTSGARTGWLDAKAGRLYVACPRHFRHDAEIRVYERAP